MEFKKIISTALIPVVILVVLGVINIVISTLIGGTGVGSLFSILVNLGVFAISCLVLLYAGYKATKKNLGLLGAALTGAIAGFVSSLINAIIGIVIMFVNPPVLATGVANPTLMVVASIIVIVIGVGFWLVAGAVLGVIGGFIGTKI